MKLYRQQRQRYPPRPASTESNGEDQKVDSSDDDSNSNPVEEE
jgi:hypothetical protein